MKTRYKNWLTSRGFWGLILFGLWLWVSLNGSSFSEAMSSNWDLHLPEGDMVYACTTPVDFLGDGDRYYIVSYEEGADLSQVVDWQWREDEKAAELVEAVWFELTPDEEYLPTALKQPYGYYHYGRKGGNDRLVMLYTPEAILGGNRYRNVLFFAETHS